MKIEEFNSGTYREQYQYKSFQPTLVNIQWAWEDPLINTLMEKATRVLSELNAYSSILPDIDLFINMHVLKEATQSSRIEGTQTNIEEAVMDAPQIEVEKRDDWEEVQNYVQAMNLALEELKKIPLSTRLLKNTHKTLMQGVRGEHKSPGEFRVSQNWIGGSNIENAVFVPPHHDDIADLMSDLENFWHNESILVPDLIKIAISHYQFETIHPFLDGNGRTGRLLITLYLVSKGLLSNPSLYLSDFIDKHRGDYYDALTRVRVSNDLAHWIKFFLTAVIETAESGKQTFNDILSLRSDIESKIVTLGKRAEKAQTLLKTLYGKPIVSVNDVATLLDVTHKAASNLVDDFVELEILQETTGFQRNRMYVFRRYLDLFG